jgi:hypothetical protein
MGRQRQWELQTTTTNRICCQVAFRLPEMAMLLSKLKKAVAKNYTASFEWALQLLKPETVPDLP